MNNYEQKKEKHSLLNKFNKEQLYKPYVIHKVYTTVPCYFINNGKSLPVMKFQVYALTN